MGRSVIDLSWRYIPALAVAFWLVGVLALRFRAKRKHKLSVEWPMVAGIFRSGVVSAFRTGNMGDAINYRLTMEISYRVGDSEHPGEYIHEFHTEEDAVALMRSLERGPLFVRYDPVSPSQYLIDPYRDVRAPQAHDSGSVAPAAVTDVRRGGINPLTNPVSLGQLLVAQVGFATLLLITPTPHVAVYWFLAGAHALVAITTTGCCWWTPTRGRLPTWVGRLALTVVAFGWILAGNWFSTTAKTM